MSCIKVVCLTNVNDITARPDLLSFPLPTSASLPVSPRCKCLGVARMQQQTIVAPIGGDAIALRRLEVSHGLQSHGRLSPGHISVLRSQ